MIDRGHVLPLARQAQQFGISRGSIYYLPRAVSHTDLAVMRRIDELHLLYPFAGSRMLRDLLRQEGTAVGRLHVATLMKRMGLEALYRRLNTSKPAPGHTRPGVYKCNECAKPFSVTVGTVMEDSKIPLNKWLLAFRLLAGGKKGFSAHELHRALGITYKSAWFLEHRIREAMKTEDGPLGGPGEIVEVEKPMSAARLRTAPIAPPLRRSPSSRWYVTKAT